MAKQRNKTGTKVNIPICLAAVLLCLTLFSMHLSSGVVARYSTDTSGADSARVIRFGDITLTKYGVDTQYIAPGVELTWNADVSFEGSEAATFVFLEVTPTGSCTASDDGMTYTLSYDAATWTVADDWKYLGKYGSNTYVYYLSLTPNVTLTNKKLFTGDTATVAADFDPENLTKMTTVSANFRAGVVQSNGFASAEEAWTSLSTNHP